MALPPSTGILPHLALCGLWDPVGLNSSAVVAHPVTPSLSVTFLFPSATGFPVSRLLGQEVPPPKCAGELAQGPFLRRITAEWMCGWPP